MALKIGVAGLRRGSGFVNVFKGRSDCDMAAVCDLNEERAKSFAEANGVGKWYASFDDFLAADLDAVVIATPAPTHTDCCIAALQAGKHVLSEVPAVWTVEEGLRLVRAVEASGRKYMFAENMNYMAFVQTFDHIIKAGRIGEPYYAEAEYIHNCDSLMQEQAPDGAMRPTWRASMPPIHYCTHSLGPVLQFLDDRIVSAVGMHTGPRIGKVTNTIDMEIGIFKTAKGSVIKITCGFYNAREPSFHYFSIYGTEGILESPRGGWDGFKATLNDIPHLTGMLELPVSWSHPQMPPEAQAGGHGTSEWLMIDDFAQAVLQDKTPTIDVYFGLDMTLPGICAHQSAENGSVPVVVPDLRPAARGEG